MKNALQCTGHHQATENSEMNFPRRSRTRLRHILIPPIKNNTGIEVTWFRSSNTVSEKIAFLRDSYVLFVLDEDHRRRRQRVIVVDEEQPVSTSKSTRCHRRTAIVVVDEEQGFHGNRRGENGALFAPTLPQRTSASHNDRHACC